MILSEYEIDKYIYGKELIEYLTDKKTNEEIDDVTDNGDGTYEVEVNGYLVTIDEEGNIIVEPRPRMDRIGLAVGDYIDYTPDPASPYTNLTAANTGMSDNPASITQDSLNWQILKINADGSMDLIGSETSEIIHFIAELGYNNGVYLMNDICKSLYSKNSAEILARSVNLKDFDYWLKRSTGGVAARNSYNNGTCTYNTPKQYKGSYSYRPDIFGKTEDESDSYYISPTTNTISGGGGTDTLDVKQTYYCIAINEINYGEGYKALTSSASSLVVSHYIDCGSDKAEFGFRFCAYAISGEDVFSSTHSGSSSNLRRLRPVVSLGSDVKIVASTGINSVSNKNTITQY